MESGQETGQVITFYSYKGGTGRTMALANVGCLLAREEAKGSPGVLLIDWDLEAPGLHRFFANRISVTDGNRPGVVELIERIIKRVDSSPELTEDQADKFFESCQISDFISRTKIPSLQLIRAGLEGPDYARRVASLQWTRLYEKVPWLFCSLATHLASKYRYVLIDSRTGMSDISGVSTMLLPEKLVIVFTPNAQSVDGGVQLAEQAVAYRKESSDLRPLVVFPLPSRVESAEPALRERWRHGEPGSILGYQRAFEECFKKAYALDECFLESYFDQVQIQHVPRYAYGEQIAVLEEQERDRLSLARSYASFAERLLHLQSPWSGSESAVSQQEVDPEVLGTVSRARNLLRANDKASWNQLVRTTRRATSANLLDWRRDAESKSTQPWLQRLAHAVNLTSRLQSIALTEIDSEVTDRKYLVMLRDVIEVPKWPRSGLRTVVSTPYVLGYIFHSNLGAFLIEQSKHDDAVDLLCTEVAEDIGGEALQQIRHNTQLTGFAYAMPKATESWKFLLDEWQREPWLSDFFVRETSYFESLRAYWLLASILELCDWIASGHTEAQIDPAGMILEVPPTFLPDDQSFNQIPSLIRRAIPNGATLDLIGLRLNVNPNAVRKAWPNWLRSFGGWYSQVGNPFLKFRLDKMSDTAIALP